VQGKRAATPLEPGEEVGDTAVRVGLGVEHGTADASGARKEEATAADDHDGPGGQEIGDVDGGLLSAVGEVVVASVHIEESVGSVHLDETAIEVGRSGVELHAVADISLCVVVVVGVQSLQLSPGEASGTLVEVAHESAETAVGEEHVVICQPRVGGWNVDIQGGDLDNVASVGLVGSLHRR